MAGYRVRRIAGSGSGTVAAVPCCMSRAVAWKTGSDPPVDEPSQAARARHPRCRWPQRLGSRRSRIQLQSCSRKSRASQLFSGGDWRECQVRGQHRPFQAGHACALRVEYQQQVVVCVEYGSRLRRSRPSGAVQQQGISTAPCLVGKAPGPGLRYRGARHQSAPCSLLCLKAQQRSRCPAPRRRRLQTRRSSTMCGCTVQIPASSTAQPCVRREAPSGRRWSFLPTPPLVEMMDYPPAWPSSSRNWDSEPGRRHRS